MKDFRSSRSLYILAFALGNLLACQALQGQAPTPIVSPLAVTAPSLDFGTVVVGNSSYLREIITNRGTVTITILQAMASRPDFAIVRPSFPLLIEAGRSATLIIHFTPQVAGSVSGVIAIAGSRQSTTVAVKGTAILPGKFSALPAAIRFGTVAKGKTQVKSETFTNNGATDITISRATVGNGAFRLTGPSLPLIIGPARSAVFSVAFTPQSVGAVRASLAVTSSASLLASNRAIAISPLRRQGTSDSIAIVPLEGTGAGQGQLTASPLSVSFGAAPVGKSMTKAVTLSNAGGSPLQLTQTTVTGAGFRLTAVNLPLTLEAGQSVNLNVVFSPPAAGNQTGSLTIVSDGTAPVTLVSLTGNSPVPPRGTLTPNLASLSFGSVPVGTTKTQSGILTNSGNSVVTISQASVSGSGFRGSGLVLPLKLSPGQSTAFSVTYSPTASGSNSGNLILVSDASNSSLAVSLAGTATAAATPGVLTSSLSTVDFATVQVGKTKVQSETLTNSGGTAVTVSQAKLTGTGFSMGGLSLPAKLNPGQTVSFTVTYAPVSVGVSSGTINLVSDASNPTVAISLSAAATAVLKPAILAQSASVLAFGSVPVGTTKTQPKSLTNTGGSATTITRVSTSGSGFAVNGISVPLTLAVGQSANFTVSYSPTAAGIGSGSLIVVSDASNSSLSTSLSGTATAAPNPGVLGAGVASLNFGSVQVGSTKSQSETLKNSGGSPVTISQATLAGTAFSLVGLDLPLQLSAGQSFTFSVVFAPSAAANASGSLSVVSDASNTMAAVALSGSGIASGQLSVTPASLSFGNVTVGVSKPLTTTLRAVNSSVIISSGQLSDPEFTLSGASFPMTLAAGQSVALTLTFTPQASGVASGSFSLASNASNSTVAQSLAGAGVAPVQHSVALSWDGSAAGYLVYRSLTSGGPYAKLTSSSTASTSYTDTAVQGGATYFYVTTSIDASGTQSGYSNEVKAVIPTP